MHCEKSTEFGVRMPSVQPSIYHLTIFVALSELTFQAF